MYQPPSLNQPTDILIEQLFTNINFKKPFLFSYSANKPAQLPCSVVMKHKGESSEDHSSNITLKFFPPGKYVYMIYLSTCLPRGQGNPILTFKTLIYLSLDGEREEKG